jgi:hypothetical protein
LLIRDDEGQRSTVTKGPLLESYEMVVNARLAGAADAAGRYGFYPAIGAGGRGPLFTVERVGAGWALSPGESSALREFPLPQDFDPYVYQQFRFRKQKGRLTIQREAQVLGQIEAGDEPTRIGLFASGAGAAFDMVRVTEIAARI